MSHPNKPTQSESGSNRGDSDELILDGPNTLSKEPLSPQFRAELLKLRRQLGYPPLPEELEQTPAEKPKDTTE